MDIRYVPLVGKTPLIKFKEEGGKTWEEVENAIDIAILVPKGYCVYDFDDAKEAETALAICDYKGVKTKVIKTTRGMHFYFKLDESKGNANFTDNRIAIGLHVDRKTSNNGMAKIKSDGAMREVIRECDWNSMDYVPPYFKVVKTSRNTPYDFKNMKEGDGRNSTLHSYILYLQSCRFTRQEIIDTIHIINQFVLDEPLDGNEIDVILREESFKDKEEVIPNKLNEDKGDKFDHSAFVDIMTQNDRYITVNGNLYVYKEGYYQSTEGTKYAEREMIRLKKNITTHQRNEVMNYLKIKTHVNESDCVSNPYVVSMANTRVDILTGELLDFTPDDIEFARLPVTYDPNAYNADVDHLIKRVFVNDEEVIKLFEEMIGYCLIRHADYQTAFLLNGKGSNGKSTIIRMIQALLGKGNYSSVSLERLTDKFMTCNIENKYANIGDDIDNTPIKDTGTLKKIFTGDEIPVEHKGKDAYEIRPYATCIFSANAIPRSFDKSDGFYRRWKIIPFNAVFSPKDEDYDPFIAKKVCKPEALSYLFNRAMEGAQRLIANERFTDVKEVEEMKETYQIENSNVRSWIDDAGLEVGYFLSTSRDQIYSDFKDWCKESGVQPRFITGKRGAFEEIRDMYDFAEKPRQGANGKRYFVCSI